MTLTKAAIDGLLQRARTGDELALAALIAGVRERVFRWALVMTGDSDDADDVTQQVSLTLHGKLHAFEERAQFTTWLYAVVRNKALGLAQKASHRREVQIDEAQLPAALSADMEAQLSRLDNERAAGLVRSFFTELPPRQRELIELIDKEGYSAAEAAALMGIEPETARVHLLRARRTIRARMLNEHPEMWR